MAEIIIHRAHSNSIISSGNPYHSTSLYHPADLSPSYELQSTPVIDDLQHADLDEGMSQPREFSLPPVDGGKDALLCLMGGFFLEMMCWGMLPSHGLCVE